MVISNSFWTYVKKIMEDPAAIEKYERGIARKTGLDPFVVSFRMTKLKQLYEIRKLHIQIIDELRRQQNVLNQKYKS